MLSARALFCPTTSRTRCPNWRSRKNPNTSFNNFSLFPNTLNFANALTQWESQHYAYVCFFSMSWSNLWMVQFACVNLPICVCGSSNLYAWFYNRNAIRLRPIMIQSVIYIYKYFTFPSNLWFQSDTLHLWIIFSLDCGPSWFSFYQSSISTNISLWLSHPNV